MPAFKLNIILNLFGSIIPAGTSFITLPFYIKYLGVEKYGVLTVLLIFINYISLIDIGLTRSASVLLAKQATEKEKFSSIFTTAIIATIIIGLFSGFSINLFGASLVKKWMIYPEEYIYELILAIPWLACLPALMLTHNMLLSSLEAHEDFFRLNVLQNITNFFLQLIPLMSSILIYPSLKVIISSIVLTRVSITGLAFIILVRQHVVSKYVIFSFAEFKKLLGYGKWISLSSLIIPATVSMDQLAISYLIGPASVSYYTIAMNVVTASQVFAASFSKALFPRFARITTSEAIILNENSTIALAYLYAIISVSLIFLFKYLLDIWVGNQISAKSALIGQILIIGAWINGLAFISFANLQAVGRASVITKFLILEFFPLLSVFIVLTGYFGLLGSAVAWCARTPVHFVYLQVTAGSKMYFFRQLYFPFIMILMSFVIEYFVNPSIFTELALSFIFGTMILLIGIKSSCVFRRNLKSLILDIINILPGIKI